MHDKPRAADVCVCVCVRGWVGVCVECRASHQCSMWGSLNMEQLGQDDGDSKEQNK